MRNVFKLYNLGPDWTELDEVVLGGLLQPEDRRFLRACVKSAAHSLLIEYEYIDKDYRNVYSGFYSKKFSRLSSRTVRLHFFDCSLSEEDLFATEGFSERLERKASEAGSSMPHGTTPGYIGAIVLRPTEYPRIGRTLLDPRKLKLRGRGEACLASFSIHILGSRLEVLAFPFQSQDSQVHTCAETALWSQFRYLSQRYKHYSEKYPHDIALMNSDLSEGRRIPSRGLTLRQVATIMGNFGLETVMYRKKLLPAGTSRGGNWADQPPKTNFDRFIRLLYTYIDSGMPPIIGLPGHAVVGIGTEMKDTSPPAGRARVRMVSDFLKSVIVQDDNYPPYHSIPLESQKKRATTLGMIDAFAVPLPEKVFLVAEEADYIATDLLSQIGAPEGLGTRWALPLVKRIVCTSSKNYKQFRHRQTDPGTDQRLALPLPHFIWLVEYYPHNLWEDREAIIEVALDATAGPYDAEAYLWVRYPTFILYNWRRIFGDTSPDTLVEGLSPKNRGPLPGFAWNLTPLRNGSMLG